MFERRESNQPKQEQFWVDTRNLPRATPNVFYRKLDEALRGMGFAEAIRDICQPSYADDEKGGRPGIDPAVYFKMLIIGFFENLPSERAIANRCADSLSLRAFLGYGLDEDTPDHSSLSVIRNRLGLDQFQRCHEMVLAGLRKAGLLKGRHLGIDSSVMEANASLRELQNRNTGEDYHEYVKKLAAEAGIDPNDAKAVRRFDKKRKGRKTSNKEWFNPHDPEAKVGRDKHGATDMLYKPEHVTDLESGVIIRAEVRAGDAGDTTELAERIEDVTEILNRVNEAAGGPARVPNRSLTGDEGYFSAEQTAALHEQGLRVVIGDPQTSKRNPKKQESRIRKALAKAKRAVKSKSGKKLLRKRGEHVERSFVHVLDQGGMRRATLRGRTNLSKRHQVAAMGYNLSILMRKCFGIGTPKQWLAAAAAILAWIFDQIRGVWSTIRTFLDPVPKNLHIGLQFPTEVETLAWGSPYDKISRFSTGC
jgi:transposase